MLLSLRHKLAQKSGYIGVIVLIGVIGATFVIASRAATPTGSIEAENGTPGSCATSVSDTSASNGGAIKFATCGSGAPAGTAGAVLPISYNLSSITGSVLYVSATGSDTGSGDITSPFATLSKAISVAPAGGTIIVRGGTYREGGLTVSKTVKIIAYPGETPVFDGAIAATSGWTASGTLSYHAYTPMPVTDGSGISFTTGQNQTAGAVGKYPDQAWVGGTQYQQVTSQAAVTAGTFYVDATNNRLFMYATDVSKGSVEISGQRVFMQITAPNVTLQGLKIIRYSNTASDYGVINVTGTASNDLMQDIYMSDSAFIAIQYMPSGSTLNQNSTIKDSTIVYSNWMGVGALATDNLTLDHDDISYMNQWGEFTASPQSGSLKTSRTWYTKVLNSKITNDQSQGLWFDQSNEDVEVANNIIDANTGSGLFFEISDNLYAVNNYIRTTGGARAVKLAGSSGLHLVNNTIIGGADPVGVYVDSRSIAGCSDPSQALCAGSYGSDRDTYHTHLATMTWIPSIDMVVDNIIAYPTAAGYCSSITAFCITHVNGSATVDISTIIHHANATTGVPQTLFDGNVYANGTGNIVDSSQLGTYSTTAAFAAGMAGAPVNISGFEAQGLAGNSYIAADGTPTSVLAALHGSAAPVPTDTIVNRYLAAGTKHYGVTWQ